jgi:cyclase
MLNSSSMLAARSRRDFVRVCAAVPLGAALTGLVLGEDEGTASLQTTKLDENMLLISGAGGNVVLIVTPDGLGLVDGGLPNRSGDFLRLVAEQGHGIPVKVLLNTHWHLDRTGSNENLGRAGAKIVAHANTRKWLRTTVFEEMQNRTYHPRPPEAIPSEIFYDSGKMTFGKFQIEYSHLPFGHTDGDISIFLPDSNILIVSDVLAVGRYPVMDYSTGGWIGGMEEANSQLLAKADAKTRIIAGTGGICSKQDLQAQHEMIAAVKDRVVKLVRLGKGYSEIVAAAPTKDFDAQWGNSDQFLTMTYRGIMRNIHEIGGII